MPAGWTTAAKVPLTKPVVREDGDGVAERGHIAAAQQWAERAAELRAEPLTWRRS